jgi:hypothetical protein
MAALSAARSAASSTRPPRAQLMMRTPFLVLASARARDVLGLVGQRRVQRDEVGAREQLVELDLLDAEIEARSGDRNGSKAITFILRPMRAVGDDRADIAAADDAQRLGVELDAHEAVLLPLAGLGRGGRRPGSGGPEREHHRDGVLGRGDRIAERRVHHDRRPWRWRPGMSTLSTPMPARPMTFSFVAASRSSASPWWPSGWRGRHSRR